MVTPQPSLRITFLLIFFVKKTSYFQFILLRKLFTLEFVDCSVVIWTVFNAVFFILDEIPFGVKVSGSNLCLFLVSAGVGVFRVLKTRGEVTSGVLGLDWAGLEPAFEVVAATKLALLACLRLGRSFSASLSSEWGIIDLREGRGGAGGLTGPLCLRVR